MTGNGRDPEVEAHCDPERVAQILRVLLDNALTHAGDEAAIEVERQPERARRRQSAPKPR